MLYAFPTSISINTLRDQNLFFSLVAFHDSTNPSIIRRTRKMNRIACFDNHGRRCGAERRQFSYAVHIPERREDQNRRDMIDRRDKPRPWLQRNSVSVDEEWRYHSWWGIFSDIDHSSQSFLHPFPAAIVWQNHTLNVSFHEFFIAHFAPACKSRRASESRRLRVKS